MVTAPNENTHFGPTLGAEVCHSYIPAFNFLGPYGKGSVR